ncbi:MAG TPA: hypothetical protein ENF44_00835 [Deltaproteobacteria bacterium]|nr:hypothetical protein [Deltaproteobacteria bacterium]
MVRRCFAAVALLLALAVPVRGSDVDQAVDYFAHVAELVVKRDASALYQEGTEGFRQGVTLEKLQEFLDMLVQGEPKGLETTGFNSNPAEGLYQVTGFITYPDGKVYIGVLMMRREGGFKLHHLSLHTDRIKGRVTEEVKPAKAFVEGLLASLRKGKMEEALGEVDPRVRREVGDEIIEAIFKKMARAEIKALQGFHYQSTERGKVQQLRFDARCEGEPCVLEFVLMPKGEGFVLLDANIYRGAR